MIRFVMGVTVGMQLALVFGRIADEQSFDSYVLWLLSAALLTFGALGMASRDRVRR